MRDPERIERMSALLKDIWVTVPNWRLGQLVCNLCREAGRFGDPFFVEDEEIEKTMRSIVEQGWNGWM